VGQLRVKSAERAPPATHNWRCDSAADRLRAAFSYHTSLWIRTGFSASARNCRRNAKPYWKGLASDDSAYLL